MKFQLVWLIFHRNDRNIIVSGVRFMIIHPRSLSLALMPGGITAPFRALLGAQYLSPSTFQHECSFLAAICPFFFNKVPQFAFQKELPLS
ncbi:hypothetical protein [Photobacterium sp. 1_MG-2023]|uniref:hypothetical protein n=1 Tax=Photobacterium sp. 1_MG-2023 TaxID=3062646 RepID=UPI0026E21DD4|nr:hypothetical protein [Photobacterium sp. 1_MG-2023]MDO6707557.1 hypothetical protein [Photobacterium sp. 1_MG-2023]